MMQNSQCSRLGMFWGQKAHRGLFTFVLLTPNAEQGEKVPVLSEHSGAISVND